MARYTIDELAHRSGVTTRNIRTYQTHGLLPPPMLVGRVGFYDDRHVARLDLIRRLQDRGYSRVAIRDLLRAWEEGGSVAEMIGVEEALIYPWDDEPELRLTFDELVALFGDDPVQRQRALDLRLLRKDGDDYVAASRSLVMAGAELVAAGVPLEAVVDISERLADAARAIATDFMDLFEKHLWPSSELGPASDERLAATVAVIERVRPIPVQVVAAAIEVAMERAAEEFFQRATIRRE